VLYYGLAAPASTPPAIIERLSKELRAAVSSDEVSKRIVSDGGDVAISTPEQYAESLARDEAKWAALVKKLGIEIGGQ
jgi:tripartite-type tricarboxylate transporter receptor subunit TctC